MVHQLLDRSILTIGGDQFHHMDSTLSVLFLQIFNFSSFGRKRRYRGQRKRKGPTRQFIVEELVQNSHSNHQMMDVCVECWQKKTGEMMKKYGYSTALLEPSI